MAGELIPNGIASYGSVRALDSFPFLTLQISEKPPFEDLRVW
jgi:hypothetical protein